MKGIRHADRKDIAPYPIENDSNPPLWIVYDNPRGLDHCFPEIAQKFQRGCEIQLN